MLAMAFELAEHDKVYSDMASKFFEHYVAIVDSINSMGGTGLWNEEDGFYYDHLKIGDEVYITVLEIKGNQVRLGVKAPRSVSVHREEIYQRIQESNASEESQSS